ncbi:MAG: CPBP family intramembrane glutamic endopeptidase [Candidatus Saccharimonadales bacterium]
MTSTKKSPAPTDSPLLSIKEILLLLVSALFGAIVLVAGPLLLAHWAGYNFNHNQKFADNFYIIAYLIQIVQLTIIAAFVYRKTRGTKNILPTIGLRPIRTLRAIRYIVLGFGSALAITILGIILVLAVVTVLFGEPKATPTEALHYRTVWLNIIATCLMAPIIEEVLFRGLLLEQLLRRYGSVVAITISSILFAVAHINPVYALGVLPLGFVLGYCYKRTRSIVPGIFIHGAWNLMVLLMTN